MQNLACLVIDTQIQAGKTPSNIVGGDWAVRRNLDQHAADRMIGMCVAD